MKTASLFYEFQASKYGWVKIQYYNDDNINHEVLSSYKILLCKLKTNKYHK